MVLPVSGFLPVPLPMMIPFMGAQSLVIGKMFGEGFQYGKRKISAMSNEEFNKLTFEDMMSNARTELKASIPTINASLQDMDEMVVVVVNEFLKYIGLVTKTVIETTAEKSGDILDAAAHLAGGHLGHEITAGTTIIPTQETFVTSPTIDSTPAPVDEPIHGDPVTTVKTYPLTFTYFHQGVTKTYTRDKPLDGWKRLIQGAREQNDNNLISYIYNMSKAFHDKYGIWI